MGRNLFGTKSVTPKRNNLLDWDLRFHQQLGFLFFFVTALMFVIGSKHSYIACSTSVDTMVDRVSRLLTLVRMPLCRCSTWPWGMRRRRCHNRARPHWSTTRSCRASHCRSPPPPAAPCRCSPAPRTTDSAPWSPPSKKWIQSITCWTRQRQLNS